MLNILEKIKLQLTKNLPFVLYSDFGQSIIKAIFQTKSQTFIVKDFNESGFIFSPYNFINNSYIIPNEFSERQDFNFLKSEISEKNLKFSDNDSKNHKILVAKAVKYIKESDLKKVVLARSFKLKDYKLNLIQFFFDVAEAYPECYNYLWYHPETGYWLGASPESLLNIKENQLETMALAGTKAYNSSEEVSWDDKNIKEQAFVTDFIEENLKKYLDSITKSKTRTVKSGSLVHLQTKISGYLKDSTILKPLLLDLHPTPAVCGYPKKLAQSFINDNETIDRKFYSGFLGLINDKSDKSTMYSNLVVNLRCMQYRNNTIELFAGSGITEKSEPEIEWMETQSKLKTLISFL